MNWPGHVGVHLDAVHADFAVVLAVSALLTAALCAVGVTAYRRRGSVAYLLVVAALAVLFARPLLGVLSMAGTVPADTHHALEHGADAVIVVLILGAAYYARSVERRLEGEP
jgi:drug/metabolite transporter (DMT)-like permease